MKAVALNASPRMQAGNTALILDPFLEGMRESGAEVELLYARKFKVNPCLGCFYCWLKHPGVCCQRDDMDVLSPKLHGADLLVLATPLYVDGMTGALKNILDRTVPFAEPFFDLRDGHCRHPVRNGVRTRSVALVSNCGFWEMDNFDPLVAHLQAVCRNLGVPFAGALLRPHGGAMRPMLGAGMVLDDVFDAAREAGRQFGREGVIAPETQRAVSRELLPRDRYIETVNAFFRERLEAAGYRAQDGDAEREHTHP
jgi:multimeric flavodoxin WrbA